jgi:8-oxo-dGTP pyrophosphatase MutT (NUDIX family)
VGLDERLDQAASREVAEEANCKTAIETYLGARVNQYVDEGITRDKTVHYFAAKWQKDLSGMDDEHSDRLWCSLEDAIQKVGDKNPKREDIILNRLNDYLELTSAS